MQPSLEDRKKLNAKLNAINSKAKGTRNEHKSMLLLEAAGYQCMRIPENGSLSVWDILGISKDGIVLVQVTSSQWPSTMETNILREFVAPRNARKLIHRWALDRQRVPDVHEL